MDAYRNSAEFTEVGGVGLTRGQVVRLEDGRGRLVRVESGAVWITHDGGDERCVKAGEACCIGKNGMTLLSAVGVPFALLTIEPAVSQPGPGKGAMQADDFVTLAERRELRLRAASERALFLGQWFKAAREAAKRKV